MRKHLVFGFDPTQEDNALNLDDYWQYKDDEDRSNASRLFEGSWRFYAANPTLSHIEVRAHPSMFLGVSSEPYTSVEMVMDDRCEPGTLYFKEVAA